MIQRSYCGEKEIYLDDGHRATLTYYILCEVCGNCQNYGAEVAMYRGTQWQTAAVHHVTTSRSRMLQMIESLRRNTVTPCVLREIILDEIGKY